MKSTQILLIAATVLDVMIPQTQACEADGCADVFIIGAGMSGAAAARELALYNSGSNSPISFLWATDGDKIGGRMKKSPVKLGNVFVEDGAGWVQGAGSNPMHLLAKEYNIEFWETQWFNQAFYEEEETSSGTIEVTAVKQNEISFGDYYIALNCVAEEGFRRHKAVQDGLYEGDDMSVRDFMIQNCIPPWEPGTGTTTLAVDSAVEFFDLDFEYEFQPEKISLNSFPAWIYGYDFQDKDLIITDERGYEEIARKYSEPAGIPMFNTRKSSIRAKWSEVGYFFYPLRSFNSI